jgi:transcriptional regulator with XRE-family HTH domain
VATMPRIAEQITHFRAKRGMSKGALARALGYATVATISHWESGRRTPTPENVRRIAEVLGCDPKQIDPDGEAFDRETAPPKGVRPDRLKRARPPADVEAVAHTQQPAGDPLMDGGIPIPDVELFGQLVGVWRLLSGPEERRSFVEHSKEYLGLPTSKRHVRKNASR